MFSFAAQDRGDASQLHAPVSDSLCERAIRRHKCEHGEWLQRSARPLCDGHALAEFDVVDDRASDMPACCKPGPREERCDESTGKWMVWSKEDGRFVEESVFYIWDNLC